MKRFIRTIALAVTLCALCLPAADARGRNNSDKSNHRNEQPAHRPGNNGHGNNGHGNNRHGNNRPAQNSNHNSRPPQSLGHHKPSHSVGHYPPPPMAKPPRPHYPKHPVWSRPTPPPMFRPAPGWRPFNTILGVAFGSAVNFTVNALINGGYNVTGYGNDAVYVANAMMLNMMWPYATLHYNKHGLYGSQFVYSTPGYSMNRYNSTYQALVNSYGRPFRTTNTGGELSSTWWGPGNQFITLSFQGGTASDGSFRYFTTLGFGN